MLHIDYIGTMYLDKALWEHIRNLPEGHMSEKRLVRNKMDLQIFALSFDESDIITLDSEETII